MPNKKYLGKAPQKKHESNFSFKYLKTKHTEWIYI